MSLKVGLYFGSFNPIHLGHLNLAQYLINHNIVDEVWFIVSPNNPLKDKSELVDHHIRYEMVKIAVQNKPYFKVSDIEFDMPFPSYTIHTLDVLHTKYPSVNFYLIIGSDNALVFDQWKDYQRILKEYPVLVYPRKGYDFKEVSAKYPELILLDSPYYDISSTDIREKIIQNKEFDDYLSPEIHDYINQHDLYK